MAKQKEGHVPGYLAETMGGSKTRYVGSQSESVACGVDLLLLFDGPLPRPAGEGGDGEGRLEAIRQRPGGAEPLPRAQDR
jgi:hypothetical protein